MYRVTELDAVRGLAAVSIMVYHLRFPGVFYGWTRVDLFFVLSGYLVTSMILRKWGTRGFFRTFLLNRCLRLAPVYFLTLLTLVAVNPLLPAPAPLGGLPHYLTFTQNVQHYWRGEVPPFSLNFFHTWSLALDVRFYLVWPLLVGLAGRRHLIPLALVMVAASVLARSAGVSPHILPARCDGFAIGGILAVLLEGREGRPLATFGLRLGFAAATLAGLAILAWGIATHPDLRYDRPVPWPGLSILAVNIVYGGLIGLLVCSSGHPALGFLRDRRLGYLGTISYGIYLLHPIGFRVVQAIGRYLGVPRCLAFDILTLAACLAAAAACWEFVEKPILALKDRRPSARGRALTATTPHGFGRRLEASSAAALVHGR